MPNRRKHDELIEGSADHSQLGNRKWTTKDKRELKWSEMSDRHIANTVEMLKRAIEKNNAKPEKVERWKETIGQMLAYLIWRKKDREIEDVIDSELNQGNPNAILAID